MGRQWPAMGSEALNTTVLAYVLLKEVAITAITPITPTIVWTQAKLQGGNTAPLTSTENWIKFWPHPSDQDPDSPTASPFHQEASISLLSFSIRGQTEWKPQLQKTNQTDHLDHSVKLLNETISHAMWGHAMVKSSDKTWSIGEGNGKPLQYSCLESPMNSTTRQKHTTPKDERPRLVGAQYATVAGSNVPFHGQWTY